MRGDEVVSVRGDADDVFSHGFLCPKSQGLKQLHDDPDRLTAPLVRRDGELVEASWEEAFAAVDEGLSAALAEGGRDAVAVYIGNPGAHSLGPTLYGAPLIKALGTKNVYTASTVDQMPKQVSSGLMFGGGLSVPIPDVDRTDHLLILGANPLVSNGSLLTAPEHARAPACDPRARRQGRGRRPAPQPDREGGLRAPLHPPRHRRPPAVRDRPRAHPRGPRRPRAARRARRGRRRDRRARRAVRARGGGARVRDRGDRDPAHGARAGGRRERRRLRADRDHDPALRHARELARRRPQLPHRQPRPRGRGDVPARRRRPAQRRRHRRRRPRLPARALDEPGQRPPRGLRRAARGRAGGGDLDPGRGAGAGAGDDRRQPAGLNAGLDGAHRRGRDARLHGLARHLRQRDHPPRGRHPPRPRAARQGPLRHGALPARRAQRGQLVAGDPRDRPMGSPRSGRSC